jgi:hypothetical protein
MGTPFFSFLTPGIWNFVVLEFLGTWHIEL